MGRTVTSVTLLDGSAGTSSRSRLALTGDDVPESVFVKMSAETAAIRMLGELANLGENEARFYSDLAPELSCVPKTYGSDFDPLTGRFAIILEDMPQDSVEFFDTTRPTGQGQGRTASSRRSPTCTAPSGIAFPPPEQGSIGVADSDVG